MTKDQLDELTARIAVTCLNDWQNDRERFIRTVQDLLRTAEHLGISSEREACALTIQHSPLIGGNLAYALADELRRRGGGK